MPNNHIADCSIATLNSESYWMRWCTQFCATNRNHSECTQFSNFLHAARACDSCQLCVHARMEAMIMMSSTWRHSQRFRRIVASSHRRDADHMGILCFALSLRTITRLRRVMQTFSPDYDDDGWLDSRIRFSSLPCMTSKPKLPRRRHWIAMHRRQTAARSVSHKHS